ncbi:YfhO family protein, partial [candidate division GN15 bacterium]|nr:YfhO family protein [candidate division GN15 bacterium]
DVDRDKETGDRKRTMYLLFGYPGLLLLLALGFFVNGEGMLKLWTTIFYSSAATEMVQQGVSKFDLAVANLPSIQSGAFLAFFFSALAAAIMWMYRERRMPEMMLLGLLVIVVVDGVRYNGRFIELVPEREYEARYESNALVEFFQRQQEQERFRVLDFNRANDNTLPFFGIDIPTGYHGNQLRWYDDFIGRELRHVQTMNARMLNLVNTRYLVVPQNLGLPADWFGPDSLDALAQLGQSVLYRNDNALPRVFLQDAYRVFPAQDSIVQAVLNGEESFRDEAWLEAEPPMEIQTDTLGQDSAWLIDYQSDTVKVGLSVTGNRLLILSDNYYDAWHATVDGEPAEILRAYGTFRAVPVPAGSQEVVFTFRSERFQTGKWVSYVTGIYLLGVIGGAWFMGRRGSAATRPEEEPDEAEVESGEDQDVDDDQR